MSFIYVYTYEALETHQDSKYNTRVKVGFTSRTPEERVKEQDTTSAFEWLKILSYWPIPVGFTDKEIHAELERLGYSRSREDKDREWFDIIGTTTSAERVDVIQDVIRSVTQNPHIGRIALELTEPQYEELVEAVDAYRAGKTVQLQELCARFGKTLWSLALFKCLDERVMVVAAYWLSALTSFKNEINKFDQFVDLQYIDTNDDEYAIRMAEALDAGKKVVIGVSLCGSKEDGRREITEQHLLPLSNTETFTFVDEADYGAWQPKQQKLVDFIANL